MPADEDNYGRRQSHQATSPASVQCPAGCAASSPGIDHSRNQSDRCYPGDKQIGDRFEPPERFQTPSQAPERFGSERSNSDRLPSGERYQGVSERYPLGDRNTMVSVSSDRLQIQNGQQAFQPERYHQVERCGGRFGNGGGVGSQNMGSLDRYHVLDRYHAPNERYGSNEIVKTLPPEMYKIKERRYQQRFIEYERYPSDRFLPIPCPERFSGQDQRVPYMEPPSPAPASDRFIPPPPISPANTPSPECYSANAFPSPTGGNPVPERFIPPPPLSPSPTESFSPKKLERYDKRYYGSSPNTATERFYDRIKDNRYYDGRYHQSYDSRYSNAGASSTGTAERYVPPHAHIPVERYVPQPQQQPESYYGTAYQAYDRYKFASASSTDPYMRRDLPYHYRLPVPYQNQFQRIRYIQTRPKCCQFQEHFQKSSPGSSSSSSVASQGNQKDHPAVTGPNQDIQCQSYYQQEKAVQCSGYQPKEYQTGGPRGTKAQCRHGICTSSVEYVGQSGGRHVCATPPPRGSVSSGEVTVCSDQCCAKRGQNTLALTVLLASGFKP